MKTKIHVRPKIEIEKGKNEVPNIKLKDEKFNFVIDDDPKDDAIICYNKVEKKK